MTDLRECLKNNDIPFEMPNINDNVMEEAAPKKEELFNIMFILLKIVSDTFII